MTALSQPGNRLKIQDYRDFRRQAQSDFPTIFEQILTHNQTRIRIRRKGVALDRLALIFNATFRLSAGTGFHAMTLRQLAEETSMSLGGLYAYIESKASLASMIQHGLKQYCMDFFHPAQGGMHSATDLEHFVRTHLYLSEWLQPWFYFSFMECKHLKQPQKQYAKTVDLETESMLAGIIAGGQTAGCFQALDPDLTAGMVKSLLQDWYLKRWKFRKRKILVDQYAEHVLKMVVCYLTADSQKAGAKTIGLRGKQSDNN